MRKNIIAAAAIAAFTLVPQQAGAQFLKKLGKALENVEKAADKVLGTGTQETGGSEAAGGVRVVNNLPGFTVEYKGVTWQKDFCGVDFVITNTGSKAERVYYFDRMKTFGADGSELQSRSIVGRNVTSLGNGDFDFEPGVPVKCTYALFDLPEGGTTVSLCQLRTQTHSPKNGYEDRFIEFRNVPVPARAAAKQAATGPFKGEWTMKGNGVEGSLTLDFYGKSITGMNASGDEMKCYGVIHVGYGQNVDNSPITAWKADGNKATVTYIGGRDGNTYESVLTLDPATGKITVSGTRTVVEEGMSNGYISDGMTFVRR